MEIIINTAFFPRWRWVSNEIRSVCVSRAVKYHTKIKGYYSTQSCRFHSSPTFSHSFRERNSIPIDLSGVCGGGGGILLALATKNPGVNSGVVRSRFPKDNIENIWFSPSLSSAFLCVGFTLRQPYPTRWQRRPKAALGLQTPSLATQIETVHFVPDSSSKSPRLESRWPDLGHVPACSWPFYLWPGEWNMPTGQLWVMCPLPGAWWWSHSNHRNRMGGGSSPEERQGDVPKGGRKIYWTTDVHCTQTSL